MTFGNIAARKLSRRRYQQGELKDEGDRWSVRWREDVILPKGSPLMYGDRTLPGGEILHRVRKWEVLSKKDFPTKRAAMREVENMLRDVNRDDYKPVSVEVFSGFAKRWEETVMIHHKPSTQRSEKSVLHVHLKPAFDSFSLRDITAEALQAWASEHTASPKTIKNIVTTLKTMWVTAKAWGYVQHDPFDGLRLPTAAKGNAYSFSAEQAMAIIAEAKGWKRVFFRILAETGIRPGELAGLRVADVGDRHIEITQSVWQRKVQTPKTLNSVRKFAISEGLSREIQAHIAETKASGLLFVAETGRPLSMDNFRHRTLAPILKRLGIKTDKRCGLYGLRHANATLMDQLNVPLKTRQKRLGHAQIETTLSHYTHEVDADDKAAADQIGALLEPKKTREAIQ